MRWGFQGLLLVQFRGNKYPVTIGNFTLDVDGIHVSATDLQMYKGINQSFKNQYFGARVCGQVVEVMNMNQYPLYSCYLVVLAVCLVFMGLYYICLKFIKQKSSLDW